MNKVDERFSYITNAEGVKFQVLRYRENEETGEMEPFDWDEEATAAAVKASEK